MWQSYIYGMHWKCDGKMYYDEVPAESAAGAVEFFNDHKRDDISLIRVEYIGPNEGGVREWNHRPDSPSSYPPLAARRRLDKEDNV
jgi:hypothetical protein